MHSRINCLISSLIFMIWCGLIDQWRAVLARRYDSSWMVSGAGARYISTNYGLWNLLELKGPHSQPFVNPAFKIPPTDYFGSKHMLKWHRSFFGRFIDMADGFFHLDTPRGTCRVADSLRKYNVPWDQYLEVFRKGSGSPENLDQVTGISVRAWLCVWRRGKVRVLLGKRAENDSSPNLYEAFGGGCDPEETVLKALIREVWEETKQEIWVIHDEVPEVEVFCTPNSKRWIAQVHFLFSVKPTRESFCGKRFGIKLDSEEHQSFIWANGRHGALGTLRLTEGSHSHFESAVAMFQTNVPCPGWQKPWVFLRRCFE